MRTAGIQALTVPWGFLRSTQEMVLLDGLETAGEQETESEQGKREARRSPPIREPEEVVMSLVA